MSTYIPDHTFTRQDIMSSILDPAGHPMPTRGRLMGFLSTAMDKTVAGCCHGLVGLIGAAVTLFSPPVCEDPDGEVQLSIPGSYDLGTRPLSSKSYPCGCSMCACAQRDDLADGNNKKCDYSLVHMEVQENAGSTSDACTRLRVSSDITIGLAPLTLDAPATTESQDDLPGSKVECSKQPPFDSQHGSTVSAADRDNPIMLARDTGSVAMAPFFERKARPASGEFNRQLLKSYTELQIRMPKLKPLRLGSSIKSPKSAAEVANPTTPTTLAPATNKAVTILTPVLSHYTPPLPIHDTSTGSALDRVAVAATPGEWSRKKVEQSTMACLKLPKLKTLRLKATGPVSRSLPSTSLSTHSSRKHNQTRAGPCGIVIVITSPNEEVFAAPGFSCEDRLERRGRVIPHKVAALEPQNKHQEPNSIPCTSELSITEILTPNMPSGAYSQPFEEIGQEGTDLEDADLSPFYFDEIPTLGVDTSDNYGRTELGQDTLEPEDKSSFYFDDFLDASDATETSASTPVFDNSYTLQDEIISLYSSSDDGLDVFSPYPTSDSGSNTSDEIVPLFERVYAQL